jgi:hypothetical protein
MEEPGQPVPRDQERRRQEQARHGPTGVTLQR